MTRAKQQTRAALVRKTRETTEAHLMLNGWFPVRVRPGTFSHPQACRGMGHDEYGYFLDFATQLSWVPVMPPANRLPMEWAGLRNGAFWRLYGNVVHLGKIRRLP